jgi:hypothetical protein
MQLIMNLIASLDQNKIDFQNLVFHVIVINSGVTNFRVVRIRNGSFYLTLMQVEDYKILKKLIENIVNRKNCYCRQLK